MIYIAPISRIESEALGHLINLINLLCVLLFCPLFWLIGVEFSNSTMLSESGKSESVYECTHTD